MQPLTLEKLREEAAAFALVESGSDEPALYGVTDGKAVGTYLEHKFRACLVENYEFEAGNSASGIDFQGLAIDMKAPSVKQPQSSCSFKSARQKIFGLGYGPLVFVYKEFENHPARTGHLTIKHMIYVEKERTADFQTTRGIGKILERDGNKDDLIAFFADRNLPVDEIEADNIADALLQSKPVQDGHLRKPQVWMQYKEMGFREADLTQCVNEHRRQVHRRCNAPESRFPEVPRLSDTLQCASMAAAIHAGH
ncbi:MAG: restriction endonuclease [Hyphomicrobiales bacterium]